MICLPSLFSCRALNCVVRAWAHPRQKNILVYTLSVGPATHLIGRTTKEK